MISHWLGQLYVVGKNYILSKKCILISFWMYWTSNIAFIIPSHKLFAEVISRQQKSPLVGKELDTELLVDTSF